MVQDDEFDVFVDLHKPQLVSSGIPEHFWKTICTKVTNEVFDAGNVFSLLQIDYEGNRTDYDPLYSVQVKDSNGIALDDPQHLYLIDHAWTFRTEHAKKQLKESAALRERMAAIMGLDEDLPCDQTVKKIFDKMWKYCNSYSIGNAENVEDRMPVWYIMDEVGCAIVHSDTPNFRIVPFIYIPEKITYSLLYPIKNASCGDFVTRDFIEGVTDANERAALLLPWLHTDLDHLDFHHVTPSPDYFLNGHIQETLPILSNFKRPPEKKNVYKVFSEYVFVHSHLKDEHFVMVDDEDEADILWYTRHFKDFEALSETPHKYVNQFPFEYVITIKDLLSVMCQRKSANGNISTELENFPPWLPTTYNLKTELTRFVSYYQRRQKNGLDNCWIVKPFNLARGLDTHITNNIDYIMRLSVTGPKIAQKYINEPVLFNHTDCDSVKFDVRYVVLLKSVKPLKVYVYKNFFLRFANKPFELDDFDDYEKHFTVMNYNEEAVLKKMLCCDFKMHWEKLYGDHPWNEIEANICKMFKEIFVMATTEAPPCGISESPQSRALYAADVMLAWRKNEIQPNILEINWMPDCKRACEYYPDFFNDVFKLLFLDEENDSFYTL